MTPDNLPPLPEPDYPAGFQGTLGQDCFSADKMRTYRQQGIQAAIAAERGRQAPLSESAIYALGAKSEVYQYHPGALLEFVREVEAAHGIHPAPPAPQPQTQPQEGETR